MEMKGKSFVAFSRMYENPFTIRMPASPEKSPKMIPYQGDIHFISCLARPVLYQKAKPLCRFGQSLRAGQTLLLIMSTIFMGSGLAI
jgi:hypothetical protein